MGAEWHKDWRKEWQIRVKKLALSYETGWEYLPGSREPGSVLTDIFLDMELENMERIGKLWQKQKREFLTVAPEAENPPRRLETALSVKAGDESDGRWMAADTRVYTVTDQGTLLDFRTAYLLRLTAARLRWIIRRRGLFAWLCYQAGDSFPVSFSVSTDKILEHPVFRWRFRGLCDGRGSFSFGVEFRESGTFQTALAGSWSLSDGRKIYPATWQQSSEGGVLTGECPEYAANLEGETYELKLEFYAEETLPGEWLRALAGGIALREEASDAAPELCLTETGPGSADRVLPFGNAPEDAACFYLACDRAAAGTSEELTLQFEEKYDTEEKSPEPEPEEFRKLYGKYPWLRRKEQIQEWRAEETLWEYFDGRLWRTLPGSEGWNTGCRLEDPGEKKYCFHVPGDMSPCSVEGEEHIYLRLRVIRAAGAYAPYYRKRIPVLEKICFRTKKRVLMPEEQDMPDIRRAGEDKLYLGFDREIRTDNCWYTGKGAFRFEQDQIKGFGERFGKEAFWAEIPAGEEELAAFLPNYAAVLQDRKAESGTEESETEESETGESEKGRSESGESGKADPEQFPKGTAFYVDTGEMGVLDAVSVADARYDRAGAPVQDEAAAAAHYFSHFGRMLTIRDLNLLMGERYSFLKAEECFFYPDQNRFEIKLEMISREENGAEDAGAAPARTGDGRAAGAQTGDRGSTEDRTGDGRAAGIRIGADGPGEIVLEEVEGWLTEAIRRMGPLWLQGAEIKCVFRQGRNSSLRKSSVSGQETAS